MSEVDIMHAIQLALGQRPDMKLWRANVGVGRALDAPDRILRFGLPGSSDLTGILGPSGRRLEIEVKSPRGRLTAEQERFGQMVRSLGGIWLVARSVEEAIAGVDLEREAERVWAPDPAGD